MAQLTRDMVAGQAGEGARHSVLRAAVLGAGFIGGVHAAAARTAGAELTGIVASTPARSKEAAVRLGAARVYADAREVIADPDIDVVHICAPNNLHLELGLAAIEAGKHIVVEKPVGLDHDEAARLCDAARGRELVATVPFVYRYHPVVREARALVRRGDLGALRLMHGSYTQDWLAQPQDSNWRVDPQFGGASRAFADIGSHWCDLAEFIAGDRIAAVSASLVTTVAERANGAHIKTFEHNGDGRARHRVTTEDVAIVSLRTQCGAAGAVTISQVSPGRKNRLLLEISGATRTVCFDQEHAETIWVGSRRESTIVVRDPESLSPEARPYAILPAGHAQGYRDCMEAFVRETYAAIRAGSFADGLPTAADGVRSAAIVDAVLASGAADGRWTEVAG